MIYQDIIHKEIKILSIMADVSIQRHNCTKTGVDRCGQVWTDVVMCVQVCSCVDRCGQEWTGVFMCGQVWTGVVTCGQNAQPQRVYLCAGNVPDRLSTTNLMSPDLRQ